MASGLVSGCATPPRNAGFMDVAKTVELRTSLHLQQYSGAPTGLVRDTIHELLREDLTGARAVRIALLSNRSLQATLEELGVARADVIQAVLPSNPVFSGHARVPDESGKTNLELAFAQPILDALFIPLRRRVAAAEFEQAKLQVGDAVLSLVTDVKTTYYAVQAAAQVRAMQQTVLQAAEAAAELAKRQYETGNINDLDLANQQAFFQQASMELTRSEAEVQVAREALNRLLGLSGAEAASWRMAAQLPEFPAADTSLEELEALAVSQRLDLAATRKETETFRRALTLARFAILPSPEVGINTETEPDGDRVTGPMWEMALPVFDWGQADRTRLQAQLRQSQHRAAALEVAVRSEVRRAYEQMVAQRQIAERYQTHLIPLQEQIVASSLRHYNFMLIGAFQLLLARQQEIEAHRGYIEALRDYWTTRAELERAVGGTLP